MKRIITIGLIVFLLSCNSTPSSDSNAPSGNIPAAQSGEQAGGDAYRFRLNPQDKSTYRYMLYNDSEITMEVNGNETNSTNNAAAETSYTVNKDSTDNLIFSIRYDKITIHTKKGNTETYADADNAALSTNPVDKMLAILKQADITAIVGLNGEVKNIKGYKELGDKMTAGFAANDIYGKNAARSQWEKLIGGNIFQGGIDKLFNTLPDSTVKPGDSWSATSKQSGEIPVKIQSVFTLKKIENNIAIIQSAGDIISIDAAPGNELANIKGDIKGTQKGTMELNIKTGMIIKNDISTKIEGTIQSMGVDVPVSIKNVIRIRQIK
ncbi:MAG: DUF6263 family protein [Agriterribacter sp.]